MRKSMLGFAIAMSITTFAACKKSGGAAKEAAAKMEGFAKDMCDCKDKACGDKVNDSMTKWSQELAKSAGKEAEAEKPDPDLTKRMTDSTQKLTECYTKLATAAATDKPADTKPADTAPPADKPADKPADTAPPADKPADTKPAVKKADDKKPDDKKSGGW